MNRGKLVLMNAMFFGVLFYLSVLMIDWVLGEPVNHLKYMMNVAISVPLYALISWLFPNLGRRSDGA